MYYFLKKYRYLIYCSIFIVAIITQLLDVGTTMKSFAWGAIVGTLTVGLPIWMYDCFKHKKIVWQPSEDFDF